MIKLTTKCGDCMHYEVCRFKNNAENAMKRLKDMTYHTDDGKIYKWDMAMAQEHVDVTFSCPSFRNTPPAFRTGA